MSRVELPTIEEDSTSSDMGNEIPAVIPIIKPKKDVSVAIQLIRINFTHRQSIYTAETQVKLPG